MPEGDVVWRTAQRLHAALAGRVLTQCDLRWPSLATLDLTGRTVQEVVSVGKHLLARADGLTLHSHLRMEGSWHVHRTGEPGPRRAEHTVRAILANDTWTAVGVSLGMLDVVPTGAEADLVGHLGPDVLGADWAQTGAAAAAAAIAADPDRAIGEALLDQRVLAGIGTFFMCEALFLRGVTPWTPVRVAGDPEALVALLRRLLWANRDRAVQATTGDARPGHQQWVHARVGRPCRRCGTTIRVAPIGRAPTDRVAFYCPHCQRGPTPTDDGAVQRPMGATRSTARSGPGSSTGVTRAGPRYRR